MSEEISTPAPIEGHSERDMVTRLRWNFAGADTPLVIDILQETLPSIAKDFYLDTEGDLITPFRSIEDLQSVRTACLRELQRIDWLKDDDDVPLYTVELIAPEGLTLPTTHIPSSPLEQWRRRMVLNALSQEGSFFDEVKVIPGNSVMHGIKEAVAFESFVVDIWDERSEAMERAASWNERCFSFIVRNDDGFRQWTSFKDRAELEAMKKGPFSQDQRMRVINDLLSHENEGEEGSLSDEDLMDRARRYLEFLDDEELYDEWMTSIGEWLRSRDDIGPRGQPSEESWLDQQFVSTLIGLPVDYGYIARVSLSLQDVMPMDQDPLKEGTN